MRIFACAKGIFADAKLIFAAWTSIFADAKLIFSVWTSIFTDAKLIFSAWTSIFADAKLIFSAWKGIFAAKTFGILAFRRSVTPAGVMALRPYPGVFDALATLGDSCGVGSFVVVLHSPLQAGN